MIKTYAANERLLGSKIRRCRGHYDDDELEDEQQGMSR